MVKTVFQEARREKDGKKGSLAVVAHSGLYMIVGSVRGKKVEVDGWSMEFCIQWWVKPWLS